jgi:putative ABC transport system permease protein
MRSENRKKGIMLENYLKMALRNILRFKIFSFINIIGLAVSISACILISLWVSDEMSYDKFNKNADRIYRPYILAKISNREINSAAGPAVMGEALQRELPEVEAYTRIWYWGDISWTLRSEGKVFSEKLFRTVDSSFFNVFTTEFVRGNPKTALAQPKTIVLTESMAHKYFGSKNPLGKIINVNKNIDFIVTGVVKDFPAQSHFHFDFLASLSTFNESKDQYWGSINCYTYVLLKAGTEKLQFEKKLNDLVRKYFSPQLKSAAGFTFEQFEAAGNKYSLSLEPLTSIHRNSHLDYEIETNSDMSYIYIFSVIAVAILLIACINFINLSTARSEKRAKEVGIRKTLGSQSRQIIGQFIAESILTSFISIIISICLVEFILPEFNNLSNKQITFNLLSSRYVIPFLLGFAVAVGLVAGSYPAFYLSSFQPVQVLKSDLRKGSRRANLRGGLVIIQFAISIILIVSTFIIYSQLQYIRKKDIGFNKDNVVIIDKLFDTGNVQSFMHDILNNPQITGISNSDGIPSKPENVSSYCLKGNSNIQFQNINNMNCDYMNCDYQFKDVYQMKMAAGRFFSKEHPSDTAAVVLNEAAARKLGIINIEGKYLTEIGNQNYAIIGIVKDFNFMSLHEAIQPIAIFPFKPGGAGEYLSVKVKPDNYAGTISFLRNTWKKYAGDETLDYSFLNNNMENLYIADLRTSNIASVFSILAIFIACLGLLGLASFITGQRTKEIGIRKVLGASVPEIIIMLSKEFLRWVILANIIAWPIAYYFMNKWLQDFAYKTEISIWIFLTSGTLALIIALLTVCTNAIKAATANPVKSLKYE